MLYRSKLLLFCAKSGLRSSEDDLTAISGSILEASSFKQNSFEIKKSVNDVYASFSKSQARFPPGLVYGLERSPLRERSGARSLPEKRLVSEYTNIPDMYL